MDVEDIPIGYILMWGDPDRIPRGWAACDGENGTIDLRTEFDPNIPPLYQPVILDKDGKPASHIYIQKVA